MAALRLTKPYRRALAPFLGLIACAALALPASALGAAKGLETEITWDVSSGVQSQDAAAMKDLGVSWTRITINWHSAEPSKGSYSSSYLGAPDYVKIAEAYGIKALRATTQEGCRAVIEEAEAYDGPVLCDLQISAEENVWLFGMR